MEALRLMWDEAFLAYDFGPGHPMSPIRLELAARLMRDLGLLSHPDVAVVPATQAADADLHLVHDPAYVAAVRGASGPSPRPVPRYGLGTDDVPVFEGMHDASAAIAGSSRALAQDMWEGRSRHAVNFAGGLHHAMPARASGFCVYNDAALAIRTLRDAGARRVAYVDVDVHHGDGVERIFWDDPSVLTISLHETGRVLFPGTGHPDDVGGKDAQGCAVNVAFPPGTGDAGWLRAFHAVVPPLLRAFEPDALVTQHGCDSHVLDPLAHMALSLDAQRASYAALHDLAHSCAGGRWLALGGGGYEVVDVVPRAWAHLVAIAQHRPLDPAAEVPQGWRAYVRERVGRPAPGRLTDGRDPVHTPWSRGHDPGDPVDRAVMATRRAVFPLHGLDPWFD
jgi:acetoin utilization protein AcuC